MAAKTPIEQLDTKLQKILDEYGEKINDHVQEAIKKVASAGVSALKKSSPRSKGAPSYGSKHYADQWAARQSVTRLSASATIYNKAPTYRLGHLLENGYAKRSGGRVAARPHIKPVEEEVIQTLETSIRRAIE